MKAENLIKKCCIDRKIGPVNKIKKYVSESITPIALSLSLGLSVSCKGTNSTGEINDINYGLRNIFNENIAFVQESYKPKKVDALNPADSEICLEDISENHIISARTDMQGLAGLEIRIEDAQNNNFGRYTMYSCDSIFGINSITTTPSIFLPDTSIISFVGYGPKNTEIMLADTVWTHELSKMIIIDRNGIDERLYMILGDENFRFGCLENSFNVSTGLDHGTRHTPLGYWHIESKDEFARNYSRGWVMPFALWYFDDSNPDHPRNGIHEGFTGTPYGTPASHGCTRVPEEFAEELFNWATEGTPVIYIDSTYNRTYWFDSDFFDIREYNPYKGILGLLLENFKNLGTIRNFLPLESSSEEFNQQIGEIRAVSSVIYDSCADWAKPDSSFHSLLEKVSELYNGAY